MILNRFFHYFSGKIAFSILSDSCLSQPSEIPVARASPKPKPTTSRLVCRRSIFSGALRFVLFRDLDWNCKRQDTKKSSQRSGEILVEADRASWKFRIMRKLTSQDFLIVYWRKNCAIINFLCYFVALFAAPLCATSSPPFTLPLAQQSFLYFPRF